MLFGDELFSKKTSHKFPILKALKMSLLKSTFTISLFLFAFNLNSHATNIGDTAPNCSLTDFYHPQQIINLKPEKEILYVDFWASWCGPCLKSFPFLQKLHQDFQSKGLKIIAINLDDYKPDAEAFLKAHPVTFKIAQDPEGQCPEQFDLKVMPSSYLIDHNGKIYYISVGFNATETAAIRAIISKNVK